MSEAASSTKVYRGLWGMLVKHFRVPEDPPEIPGRDDGSALQFKPAPPFLKYLQLWFWIVIGIVDLLILAAGLAIFFANWHIGLALSPIFLIVLFVPALIGLLALQLRFDTTWYVMTDRALRIRRGVWIIDERTITYENIQNVKVAQGPLQRHFGFATVVVETAGAGASGGKQGVVRANQGVLEGITNAPEIRDRILRKMRESGATGLGDDEPGSIASRQPAGLTAAQLDVLRAIRDELAATA